MQDFDLDYFYFFKKVHAPSHSFLEISVLLSTHCIQWSIKTVLMEPQQIITKVLDMTFLYSVFV
jgi:hypothetical protein